MNTFAGRCLAATAAIAVVAAAAVPVGAQQQTDVTLAAIGGSRVLTVTTAGGGSLSGGELNLGAARRGTFAVNVADADYDHVGYQVSATISNLYRFDALTGFDCANAVPAGDVSTSFPAPPTVGGVTEIVRGLVDLVGTVTASLEAALDPDGSVRAILTPLGVPLQGQQVAIQDLVTQTTQGVSGILDGLDARLPVRVSPGVPGAFSNAAAHATCGGGATTPTQTVIMAGDASSLGDLFETITAGLEAAVNGVSGSALVAAGTIAPGDAEAGAVQEIRRLHDSLQQQAGVPLPPLSNGPSAIAELLDAVAGVLDSTSLAGQSGTYLSTPILDAGEASAPQSGTYRGTLTVTIVDTP